MDKVYHPYHLVDPSPWPYVMGCAAFLTTLGAVIYFHYSQILMLCLGLVSVSVCMFLWLRDVVRESTFQGFHTKATVNGVSSTPRIENSNLKETSKTNLSASAPELTNTSVTANSTIGH